MKVVILAGGAGTRAYPYTEYLPKPMMPVGGKPILLRVMDIYAMQGITEFVISVGYRKEIILDYFDGRNFGWKVDIVDTGAATDTGGRIWGCRHLVGDTFMATYADGLSDVTWPTCWPSIATRASSRPSPRCRCARSTAPSRPMRRA